MDIIEIALDKLTDFTKFELIANQVVSTEGYPNVRIIAGIDDDGIDAKQVQYYIDKEAETTIFQYSLQKNPSAKITDTIEKLITNNVKFNELVLVTPIQINNVGTLTKKVREKYKNKIRLDIIERKTFITSLSKNNHLFYRYFPDIKKQLQSDLFDKSSIFSEHSDKALTKSLLKCSLLFTFNPDIQIQRKSLFDNTILSIVADKKDLTIENIQTILESEFDKALPDSQIQASLKRLIKSDFIKRNEEDKYILTTKAVAKIEGNVVKINSATEALINEVCAKTIYLYNQKVSIQIQNILERNTKKALSSFFRLHGLDYYHSTNGEENSNTMYFNWDIENEYDIIETVKVDLPKQIGELLVYSIGELIKNPTVEQADILANWSKAFIGVQIMGLDPILKDFQIKELSEKTFLLDTDFVLYCIVDNCIISPTYQKILNELVKIGCNIVIPEAVVYEVTKHAEYSVRSYNYFRNTFDVVDELVIEDKIPNVFVKDYYQAVHKNSLNMSFNKYLSNYLNKEASYDYMVDLIKDRLPKKVQIKEVSSLLNEEIPADILENLTKEIYNETVKTFKSLSRSIDENEEIARNDAKFYLTSYYLTKGMKKNEKEILSGDYYLITTSNRAVRCARKLNIYGDVIVKPQTILGLLESVGFFTPTSRDVVSLFDNPFLINAVNENWSSLKDLVDAGIDLSGKNIVRLKWDLDETLHKYFTYKSSDNADSEENENDSEPQNEVIDLDDFANLAKEVKSKGYKFIPTVDKLIDDYEKTKADKNEQERINSELSKSIEKFGKRKQHYLKKIQKNK